MNKRYNDMRAAERQALKRDLIFSFCLYLLAAAIVVGLACVMINAPLPN